MKAHDSERAAVTRATSHPRAFKAAVQSSTMKHPGFQFGYVSCILDLKAVKALVKTASVSRECSTNPTGMPDLDSSTTRSVESPNYIMQHRRAGRGSSDSRGKISVHE